MNIVGWLSLSYTPLTVRPYVLIISGELGATVFVLVAATFEAQRKIQYSPLSFIKLKNGFVTVEYCVFTEERKTSPITF